MRWSYRVVRQDYTYGPEATPGCDYTIYEVYYDDAGRVTAWSEAPAAPFGETPEELAADMNRMFEALSCPVILFRDLPGASQEPRGLTGKKDAAES